MIPAQPSHKAEIVRVLTASFLANQSINYVVRQDARREQRIRKLVEYSFDLCWAFGEVWLSDDGRGCALVLFPDQQKTTWQTIRWEIALALTVFGLSNVPNVLRRESQIREIRPKTPLAHLWYIGVDPEHQGGGTGSKLLDELVGRYKKQNRPIYLETSTVRNVPWYERHGFTIYQKLFFTYELFMLRQD